MMSLLSQTIVGVCTQISSGMNIANKKRTSGWSLTPSPRVFIDIFIIILVVNIVDLDM